MTGELLIEKNSEEIGCGLIVVPQDICLEELQKSMHCLSLDSWLSTQGST
jgi:hypothetical protein